MHLIDTHVHLNFEAFEPDFEQVVQRWREAGVVRLVHSCVEPSEFEEIQDLARRCPELFFAVGLHPLDVAQWTASLGDRIQSLAASDSKVVAIGETGLDLYRANNPAEQLEAFKTQLLIAQRLSLPVIVHCRDAAQPMADFLRAFWQQYGPVKGVMHCWGGMPEETQWFLELGFFISFSGTVTFKNAVQIHKSAQIVPIDRLLIETDCPFLAPVPKRGERRNEPAYVYYVAQRIADLRHSSLEEIAAQTTRNACTLFNLPRLAEQPVLVEA